MSESARNHILVPFDFGRAFHCAQPRFICVYLCVFCAFVFHTAILYAVLLSAKWGGSGGIEAQSLGLLFFQCFDTVGWVFWPIKPVPNMTYIVFGGTLNLAQFNSNSILRPSTSYIVATRLLPHSGSAAAETTAAIATKFCSTSSSHCGLCTAGEVCYCDCLVL